MAKINNRQEFIKERNRILNGVRIGEKQGKKYDTSLIPNLPNRVTAKQLQEIKKIKPKSIRVGSEFIGTTERTATPEELVTKKVKPVENTFTSTGSTSTGSTSSYLEKPLTLPPSDYEIIERIVNRLYNTISDKYTIDIDDVSDYVYKIYEEGGLEAIKSIKSHDLYEFAYTDEGITAKERVRRARAKNLEVARKAKALKRPPKTPKTEQEIAQVSELPFGLIDRIIDRLNEIPDHRIMHVGGAHGQDYDVPTGDFRDHIISNIYNRIDVYGEAKYTRMLMDKEQEIMDKIEAIMYASIQDPIHQAYTDLLEIVLGRTLTSQEYEELEQLDVYENEDDWDEE